MPAPPPCVITGTAYLPTGEVQTNAYLDIVKVYLDDAAIGSEVQQVPSVAGVFSFTLPRGSIAYIRGNIVGFNTATKGHAVEIPDASSATLESLLPVISASINGVSRGDLEAAVAEAVGDIDLSDYQPLSAKNQANGYCGLDGSGLVADSRLPSSIARDSEVTSAVSAEASTRANADAALDVRVDVLEAGGAGERQVAAASFNLNSASSQVLYTVPAGKRFLMTKVLLRGFTAIPSDGATDLVAVSGGAGASGTAHAISGITTLTGVHWKTVDPNSYESLAAGGTITGMVSELPYGAPATCIIEVYGILY